MTTLQIFDIRNDAGALVRRLIVPAAFPETFVASTLPAGWSVSDSVPLVDYLARHSVVPVLVLGVPSPSHEVRPDGSHDIELGGSRLFMEPIDGDGIAIRVVTGDDYWQQFGMAFGPKPENRPVADAEPRRWHPLVAPLLLCGAVVALIIFVL